MNKVLAFLSIFACLSAQARFDFKLDLAYRNSPEAGGLSLESGLGAILWGRGNTTSFIRPFITINQSLDYSGYGGGVDFYLFKFLGFRANYKNVSNTKDYDQFNCSLYRCIDKYSVINLESRIYFAAGAFFGKVIYKTTSLAPDKNDKDFIWPTVALTIGKDGDSYQSLEGVIGIKLIKGLRIMYSQQELSINTNEATQRLIMLKNSLDDSLSINIGIGDFSSQLKSADVMGVVILSWVPRRGLLIE